MRIAHTIDELRAALAAHPASARTALVPTMGNLHAGHIALVQQARGLGDVLVSSIFVNRLQFLPNEDFDRYPRTWDADCAQLQAAGCDIVFAPREADLYPEPQAFTLHPDPALADILEGQFRPGFFTGVCTVVLKLFAAVFFARGGGTAVFGKKDYQQWLVIRRMVQQLALPVEIVAAETTRDTDGLALSSRNGYLSAAQRAQAVQLRQALLALAQAAAAPGAAPLPALEDQALQRLAGQGWSPDYLTVRQRQDLQPPPGGSAGSGHCVALGAARLGSTRLIDSLEF